MSNLQCLCQFHHNLKTMGRYRASMFGGGVVVWDSAYGTTTVTLPGGTVVNNAAAGGLVPRCTRRCTPRQGRRSTSMTYSDDEPPPF